MEIVHLIVSTTQAEIYSSVLHRVMIEYLKHISFHSDIYRKVNRFKIVWCCPRAQLDHRPGHQKVAHRCPIRAHARLLVLSPVGCMLFDFSLLYPYIHISPSSLSLSSLKSIKTK